jgi:hypothetical protein
MKSKDMHDETKLRKREEKQEAKFARSKKRTEEE